LDLIEIKQWKNRGTDQLVIEEIGDDSSKYIGIIQAMSNQGPVQIPFDFPDNMTLTTCFETFDVHARLRMQALEAEQREQQRQENLIVDPAGKPMPFKA